MLIRMCIIVVLKARLICMNLQIHPYRHSMFIPMSIMYWNSKIRILSFQRLQKCCCFLKTQIIFLHLWKQQNVKIKKKTWTSSLVTATKIEHNYWRIHSKCSQAFLHVTNIKSDPVREALWRNCFIPLSITIKDAMFGSE